MSDGEPAIVAVKKEVANLREAVTVPEETPVGEHNANIAEGLVRRVREQAMPASPSCSSCGRCFGRCRAARTYILSSSSSSRS